jgi:hypothetical protein
LLDTVNGSKFILGTVDSKYILFVHKYQLRAYTTDLFVYNQV